MNTNYLKKRIDVQNHSQNKNSEYSQNIMPSTKPAINPIYNDKESQMIEINYSNKRILAIDDQKSFLAVLRSMLNSLGAKSVVTANHCEGAIKYCEQEKFDIIICDLHFGENRQNGFQFLEELNFKKLLKPETVFVMSTADAQRPMVLGSIEKYPDEYLIKPFSRAQLELRLTKQIQKKVTLYKIYDAIHNDELENAIHACKQQLKKSSTHQKTCIKLLTKLYWKTNNFTDAKQLLSALSTSKTSLWVGVFLAQTEYLLGNYQEAINAAKKVIVKNKLFVDAHDIMAASYLKLNKKRDAFYSIEKALYFSPYSLERNVKACDIARENLETRDIVNYSRQIWKLSRYSIHQNIAHLCTHLRSCLDLSEEVSDPSTKYRIQQETFQTLNKYQSDTNILTNKIEFDSKIYKSLLEARVHFQNNQLDHSKNTFNQAQIEISKKYSEYPLFFAADSIKVMFDLGEFDEANNLFDIYSNSEQPTDRNTQASILAYQKSCLQPQNDFIKHNSRAIELFANHQYPQALDAFKLAQKVAPANSAIALNLLKCKLRLIEITPSPQAELVNSCKSAYKSIKNMVMLDNHKFTFEQLKTQAERVLFV